MEGTASVSPPLPPLACSDRDGAASVKNVASQLHALTFFVPAGASSRSMRYASSALAARRRVRRICRIRRREGILGLLASKGGGWEATVASERGEPVRGGGVVGFEGKAAAEVRTA